MTHIIFSKSIRNFFEKLNKYGCCCCIKNQFSLALINIYPHISIFIYTYQLTIIYWNFSEGEENFFKGEFSNKFKKIFESVFFRRLELPSCDAYIFLVKCNLFMSISITFRYLSALILLNFFVKKLHSTAFVSLSFQNISDFYCFFFDT